MRCWVPRDGLRIFSLHFRTRDALAVLRNLYRNLELGQEKNNLLIFIRIKFRVVLGG